MSVCGAKFGEDMFSVHVFSALLFRNVMTPAKMTFNNVLIQWTLNIMNINVLRIDEHMSLKQIKQLIFDLGVNDFPKKYILAK